MDEQPKRRPCENTIDPINKFPTLKQQAFFYEFFQMIY
jgi:hypothetical protein